MRLDCGTIGLHRLWAPWLRTLRWSNGPSDNSVALLDHRFDASRWAADGLNTDGGAGDRNYRWPPLIDGIELGAICGSCAVDLYLSGYGRCPNVAGLDLARPRAVVDATVTAVVADAVANVAIVGDVIHDHRPVVDVGDVGGIDVGDSTVVIKAVALPVAAVVAGTDIPVAVVNTAVEADMRTPVAMMEAIPATEEAPVGRRPEGAVVGRGAPNAWRVVIAGVGVRPVAGRPEVVRFGSGRLLVLRKRRRWL
jgi:hypothetical protein